MVEVFRTNVSTQKQADFLFICFQKEFPNNKINFDLEDCDNILRVETDEASINVDGIIDYMKSCGLTAEILPDEPVMYKEKEKIPNEQGEIIH